jgi:hypothetical protein
MSLSKLKDPCTDDSWTTITRMIHRTKPNQDATSPRKCLGQRSSACNENWAMYVQCPDAAHDCANSFPPAEPGAMEKRPTTGKGYGMYATTNIPAGTLLGEYLGEIISASEERERYGNLKPEDAFYHFKIDNHNFIDARRYGTEMRFLNHSESPNCTVQKWTVDGQITLRVITSKDIATDTELTYNYFYASPPPVKIPCRCMAPNCSGYMGRPTTGPYKARAPRMKQIPGEPLPHRIIILASLSSATPSTCTALPHLTQQGQLTHHTMHAWLTAWSRTHALNYNANQQDNREMTHWILSTHFYPNLPHNPDPTQIRSWTRHTNIHTTKHIHVPVQLTTSKRWILITLDTEKHTATCLDPAGDRHPQMIHRLTNWWGHALALTTGHPPQQHRWKTHNPKISTELDSGLLVLLHIAQLTTHTQKIETMDLQPRQITEWLIRQLPTQNKPLPQQRQKKRPRLLLPERRTHRSQSPPIQQKIPRIGTQHTTHKEQCDSRSDPTPFRTYLPNNTPLDIHTVHTLNRIQTLNEKHNPTHKHD